MPLPTWGHCKRYCRGKAPGQSRVHAMETNMKSLFKTLKLAVAGIVLSAGAAQAEETVLTLSNWLPPSHPVVTDMIQPWADQVKEATEGRVSVNILAKGLGHPKVHFDIARDGLADVTFSVHGYTPGRFLLTQVAEFPFSGNSSEALSVAYWKVHQKYFAQANEHAGTKLLGLFTHGPGQIHTLNTPVKSASDLKGLKMRVGGGAINDVATALGSVPLLKPARESFELLSHGVADGTYLPMESVTAFNVDELLKNTTLVPGGLYNISFFLVMNEDRFNGLSKADQEAVMSVSGEHFARLAGKAWDAADSAAMDKMKAQGNQIITADSAFIGEIIEVLTPIEEAWIAEAKAKGVDGKAALEELRALTKAYQ